MSKDTESQHSEASPERSCYIRHVYLSPEEVRKGGYFLLRPREHVQSAVLRSDGSGLDLLIVMTGWTP